MIISKQKSIDTIIDRIEGHSVFLVGCNECATLCHTGGEKEVLEIKQILEDKQIFVTGWVILDPACHLLNNKRLLKPYKEKIESADYLLLYSCGDGLQVMAELYPEKKIISGTDTLFLGAEIEHSTFSKQCLLCGSCIADEFETLCPVSRCPKNMLNGPCGGSMNGRCELSDQMPCVWHDIVQKKIQRKKLQSLQKIAPPKDWTVYQRYQWRKKDAI